MALLIAGLPLNVYTETISEPLPGRFQPPGITLHLPGVCCVLHLRACFVIQLSFHTALSQCDFACIVCAST